MPGTILCGIKVSGMVPLVYGVLNNGIKQTLISGTKRYYGRTLDAGYVRSKWGCMVVMLLPLPICKPVKNSGHLYRGCTYDRSNDRIGDTVPHTRIPPVWAVLDITKTAD